MARVNPSDVKAFQLAIEEEKRKQELEEHEEAKRQRRISRMFSTPSPEKVESRNKKLQTTLERKRKEKEAVDEIAETAKQLEKARYGHYRPVEGAKRTYECKVCGEQFATTRISGPRVVCEHCARHSFRLLDAPMSLVPVFQPDSKYRPTPISTEEVYVLNPNYTERQYSINNTQ